MGLLQSRLHIHEGIVVIALLANIASIEGRVGKLEVRRCEEKDKARQGQRVRGVIMPSRLPFSPLIGWSGCDIVTWQDINFFLTSQDSCTDRSFAVKYWMSVTEDGRVMVEVVERKY